MKRGWIKNEDSGATVIFDSQTRLVYHHYDELLTCIEAAKLVGFYGKYL